MILLIIIYLAFISLGLPDSLLGSAWTVMRHDFNATLGYAGIISMSISAGTILSSLFSEKLINRFGTGKVTFVSVFATAIALFGFSTSHSFILLLVFAIPLGLGAGSVDAGLNNFVAVHYKPCHMSWLHCFWGVGATIGPMIMAQCIQVNNNWSKGFRIVSIIQFSLVIILFLSLPLWKKQSNMARNDKPDDNSNNNNIIDDNNNTKVTSPFSITGVIPALITFLFYCGIESTVGLWGSSFLVNIKELTPTIAARWISMYYAGITIGRLITGFITLRLTSKSLIRMGQIIILCGTTLFLLPLPSFFALIGLILIGLGCAPIFPCMIHETPHRFGVTSSQKIMGLQMAFAYIGSTFLPPIFGLIASNTSIIILPAFILAYVTFMILSSERINRVLTSRV